MSPFEILMLLSFGAAWPFSIYRSIKSKSTKGKSVQFLIILFFGYVFGITHKILYNFDMVILFYILNLTMVGIDISLYFRNKRNESKQTEQSS